MLRRFPEACARENLVALESAAPWELLRMETKDPFDSVRADDIIAYVDQVEHCEDAENGEKKETAAETEA